MSLETMSPNPVWNPAGYEDAIDAVAERADELTVRIWAGDWCKDCRAVLPDFAAALDEAGVPEGRIEEHALDQDKQGELVAEYDIEYIPTIVVEREGREVARFVEDEPEPPIVHLAEQLDAPEPTN
jgi:thioredoxin-like negative regulator of GroEL